MAERDGQACTIEVRCQDPLAADRIAGEAWEAGVLGIEERGDGEGPRSLVLYLEPAAAPRVRDVIARVPGATGGPVEPVPERDWSEAWRAGATAIEIGEHLVVRPSFVETSLRPGQRELVIDPGQAFGTGGHESTRLLLEWIEQLGGASAFEGESRILDVGAGTGVLGLAALRFGAGRVVAFDLDPACGPVARQWAAYNGLAERFATFVGGIEALGAVDFDWVFANLLKREMLPIAPGIAAATRRNGGAIFSGLLSVDREEAVAALDRVGFSLEGIRAARDGNGDEWISLRMRRR